MSTQEIFNRLIKTMPNGTTNTIDFMLEKIGELEQQLADREKQIVMMRNHMAWALSHYSLRVGAGAYLEKALAATQDLSELILCDAEPATWRNKCSHGWYVYSPSKLDDEQEPLYKARNP
jgi:hypothetical protein